MEIEQHEPDELEDRKSSLESLNKPEKMNERSKNDGKD